MKLRVYNLQIGFCEIILFGELFFLVTPPYITYIFSDTCFEIILSIGACYFFLHEVFREFLKLIVKRSYGFGVIKNSEQSILFFMVLFYATLIFSSFVHDNQYVLAAKSFIYTFALVLMFKDGVKTNRSSFFRTTSIYFRLLIIINLLLLFIYPQGMYYFEQQTIYGFLGHKNTMLKIMFPGLVINLYQSYLSKNKFNMANVIDCFLVMITVLKVGSATSIVVMLLVMVILLFIQSKAFNIKYNVPIILGMVVFFGVVIFRVQDNFSYIIVNILGRDLSFTGRTRLWDNAIELFKTSPIYGVGYLDRYMAIKYIGNHVAHNYILDTLYEGGLLCLFFLLFIIFVLGKEISKNYKNVISQISIMTIGIYILMWQFEPFDKSDGLLMFPLFMLIYCMQLYNSNNGRNL